MKRLGIFLLIIVIIGAIMFVLNPTSDNFDNYLERVDSRNIKTYTQGTRNVVDENTPSVGNLSDIAFGRRNFYIYSIYESKDTIDSERLRYVGMFKTFFKMN